MRYFYIFSLIIFVSMVGQSAFAYDFKVLNSDGVEIYYELNSDQKTVSVCEGAYVGDIVIPESVTYNETAYKVTAILANAFYKLSYVTSVVIPNSVTSIGQQAFAACEGLKSVTIGNKVTSIGYETFLGCSSLTSVVVPSSVTTIGEYAFCDCTNLTTVTLSTGLKTIENSAFYNCQKLSSVTLPSGVTSISDNAFCNCVSLSSLKIPQSVTYIGAIAFQNCSNIASISVESGNKKFDSRNNCNAVIESASNTLVFGCMNTTIPGTVTSIGKYAFFGSSLTTFTLSSNISSIGIGAFSNCNSLTSISVESGNATYDSRNNCNAVIETATNTLVVGCSTTKIPDNVTSIGPYAFFGCANLTSITIPNGVTSLGNRSFWGCNLSAIVIPSSVSTIGNYAFSGSKAIWQTNTPPTGYKNINCSVNYVPNNQFSGLNNVIVYPSLSSLFEVDGIKYVPVSTSERTCDAIDCVKDQTIVKATIPATVTFQGITLSVQKIQQYFCYGNSYLDELSCNNVGEIASYAVGTCENLKKVVIGDKVSGIGDYAFSYCSSLQSVSLSNSVSTLGTYSFRSCKLLESINIPQSVKTIDDGAFEFCLSLKKFIIEDREDHLALKQKYWYHNAIFDYCPLDSVYIGGNISYTLSPFSKNTTLRSLTISGTATEILTDEFNGCTNLQNLTIGDRITTIGNYAFSGCSAIEQITSKAVTPPTCGTQALDDINKWNCKLYVPEGSLSAYQQADQWKDFFFIEESTGIRDIKIDAASGNRYYTLDGHLNTQPHKGINIIKRSDGKSYKVIAK